MGGKESHDSCSTGSKGARFYPPQAVLRIIEEIVPGAA